MSSARGAVEELVGAAAGSVALVENATTAGSAVAYGLASRWHSGEWETGDKVLLCSLTYDSVENAVVHYCGTAGAAIDKVELPLPVTRKDEVVAAYADYFARQAKVEELDAASPTPCPPASSSPSSPPTRSHPRPRPRPVRAAMLDHVHSKTGYVMPIAEIIALLRSHGVEYIYVDGAHAPGQLHLNLPSFGCDAYAGNLHKWCFSGAGSAFLWSNPRDVAAAASPSSSTSGDASADTPGGSSSSTASVVGVTALHHPVVSHDLGKGFVAEADFTGTKDYTPYWTVPVAFQFVADMGGWSAIRQYCHTLVMAAAKMLAAAWGTELGQPEGMVGSMVLVGLPQILGVTEAAGAALRGRLLARDRIQVQYPVVSTHGTRRLFVRISAMVYNCEEDYLELKNAVLKEVAAVNAKGGGAGAGACVSAQ